MQHAREDPQDGTDPRTEDQVIERHQLLPLTSPPQDIRSERASIAYVSDQSVLKSIARGEHVSGLPLANILIARRPPMDAFRAAMVLCHDTCRVFCNDNSCCILIVLAFP